MKKGAEDQGVEAYQYFIWGYYGTQYYPMMENQMQKKMENEMETGQC